MPKVDGLEITLPDPGNIPGIVGKKLQDLDEGLELFELSFSKAHTFALGAAGKLKLSASADAAYRIEVFNDDDDNDEDRVWNVEEGDDTAPIWDQERAEVAVKHQVVARLGTNAACPKLPLPGGFSGTIGIEANGAVKLAGYKGHAGADGVVAALRDDVSSLRLPVKVEHVRDMVNTPGNYEVMFYKVLGTFGMGIDLSWGEILSVNSVDISTPLGTPGTIGFELSGMATVGFNVSFTSELELAVSPLEPGVANLRFHKVKTSELGFKGKLGLTVEPRDAGDFVDAVDRLVAQAVGYPTDKLDELIDKLKQRVRFEDLPEELKGIATALEKRLDSAYDKLLAKYQTEIAKFTGKVKELATRKVAAAVTFEYERISIDEALLDVDLWIDEAPAASAYQGLLVGDFDTIMAKADEPWVRVNDFLRRSETVSSFSYGLGLSWGDKRLMGNKTTHRFKESVQVNTHDHRRISWVSILTGSDYGIGVKSAPEITFTAAMQRFKKNPAARDFEFSFNFSWVHEQKDLSQAERFEMVDLAALFGAIQPDWESNHRLLADVAQFARRNVTFTVNLAVGHDGMMAALSKSQDDMKAAFIDGLAAGVYYWHRGDWRHSFVTRKCLYRAPMEEAVLHERETFPALGSVCNGFKYDSAARHFDSSGFSHARGFYRLREETIEALPSRIRPFFKAWGRWKQALGEPDPDRSLRELKKAIQGIDDAFTTPLRQRALGHMLLTLLADRPDTISVTVSFVHDATGDALSYRRNRG